MISGSVTGDAEVKRWLQRVPRSALGEIKQAVARITFAVMTRSVGGKLSGQVLKRRTGTLARSVTQSPRTYLVGNTLVVGTVGTVDLTGPGGRQPVKYGAMHEFGFQGTVDVRAHLREIRQAWGRQLKQPQQITVAAHQRQVNLPERSWLRSALADVAAAGTIDREITAALDRALKD